MKKVSGIVIIFALSACGGATPVAELRNYPPDEQVIVSAPIEKVAPCLGRLMSDYGGLTGGKATYIFDQATRTAEITAYNTREPLVLAQLSAADNTTVVDLKLGIRYVVNSPVPYVAKMARSCAQ